MENSYKNSLHKLPLIMLKACPFPSLSSGAFEYLVKEASEVAIKIIIDYLKDHPEIELVSMVIYSEGDYKIYKEVADILLT